MEGCLFVWRTVTLAQVSISGSETAELNWELRVDVGVSLLRKCRLPPQLASCNLHAKASLNSQPRPQLHVDSVEFVVSTGYLFEQVRCLFRCGM